ncbi:MAG: hypothetical protein OEY59_05320 [Deltaproteobacteria bacterium]|nr:hypothetical protein [Deltaproteobacteria bacterium]
MDEWLKKLEAMPLKTKLMWAIVIFIALPFIFLILRVVSSHTFRLTVTLTIDGLAIGALLYFVIRFRNLYLGLGMLLAIPMQLSTSIAFADFPFFIDHSAVSRFTSLQVPSGDYLLGTDYEGRDILATIIIGGMHAYLVALITTLTAMLVGIPSGIFLSSKNRYIQSVATSVTQFFEIVPQLFFVLIIMGVYNFWAASAAGSRLVSYYSVPIAGIAIGLSSLPSIARILENRLSLLKSQRFVTALKSSNVKPSKILLYNLLWKNCVAELLIQATFLFGAALLLESALGYAFEIGFGDLGTGGYLSWGKILAEARRSILFGENIYVIIPPIIVTLSSILGVNILGDSLAKHLRS